MGTFASVQIPTLDSISEMESDQDVVDKTLEFTQEESID